MIKKHIQLLNKLEHVDEQNLIDNYIFKDCPTIVDSIRFLKTKNNNNKVRFIHNDLLPAIKYLVMNNDITYEDTYNMYIDLWDKVSSFSYTEAFECKNDNFSALIFSVIDIPEMIKHLGNKRISTEGIELTNKTYNEISKKFEYDNLHQIYELHAVDGTKLGINVTLYAIKCWCTSTNNEHWLWIDKKMPPLDAIASLCKVYKSMIPYITGIIRQGDVFIFEMKDATPELNLEDEIVSLNKNQYFKLLKSQS